MSFIGVQIKRSIISLAFIVLGGFNPAIAETLKSFKEFNNVSIDPVEIKLEILNSNNTDHAPSIELTLEECINRALKSNPIIQKYKFDIQAQRQLFYAAKTKWLPTVQIEGDPALTQYYERATQELIVPQPSTTNSSSGNNVSNSSFDEYNLFSLEQNLRVDLYVEWNIIDATRTPLIKSEWQLIKQKENLLRLAARKLIGEVTIAYINTQAAQKTIDELQPLIDASIKSEQNLEKQLAIGYRDISQLLQSQTQLLNIFNYQINAKGARDKYGAELASLIGEKNGVYVYAKEKLKAPAPYKFSLSEAIELSKVNNELAQAYIDEAESLEWESISNKNQYLPKLFLYLNWYYGNAWGISDAPISSPDIAENSYFGEESGYYAGLGFTWTFDGGGSYFKSKNEKISGLSLRESAKSAEISFLGMTKSNYSEFQSSMRSIELSLKAMKASSLNLASLRIRSEYGLEDMTTIVQAFDLYNQSLNQWVEAVRLANISLANLYRYTSLLPNEEKIDSLLKN